MVCDLKNVLFSISFPKTVEARKTLRMLFEKWSAEEIAQHNFTVELSFQELFHWTCSSLN